MNLYSRVRNIFIGDYLKESDSVFDKARTLLMFDFTAFMLIGVLPYEISLFLKSYTLQFYINFYPLIMVLVLCYMFLRHVPLKWIAGVYTFVQISNCYAHALTLNFPLSMVGAFWILLGIQVAFFVINTRAGIISGFFLIFYILFGSINQNSGFQIFNSGFSAEQALPENGIIILMPVFLNIYMLWLMAKTNKKAELNLVDSHKRNEELLLNILPGDVAAELKEKGSSEARLYDNVTILFADIHSFTKLSEELKPEEIVGRLDKHFRAFDGIVEKYGIEKIKTIGDAYLCICGAPHPDHEHAVKMVSAAKEFIKANKEINESSSYAHSKPFEFRVGIHSGSIVAGVVGVKKFAYDIWGDAVNTAARMEQNGEENKINISQATYELVHQVFDCEYRGEIAAKNKGPMKMYFVR